MAMVMTSASNTLSAQLQELHISPAERAVLHKEIMKMTVTDYDADIGAFESEAAAAIDRANISSLQGAVANLSSGWASALRVKGIDYGPVAPTVPGKCLHPTHVPQAVLAGLASKLRCMLVGYGIEKVYTHPFFHDIRPVRGKKEGSNGDGDPLDMHMDMSYTKDAPDFVALAALREGPDPNVTTPLVENRQLYKFLAERSPQDIAVLRDPASWKISQPDSTGGGLSPPMPLLTGDENMVTFWLRVKHEKIIPQHDRAKQALIHLQRALTEVETHSLHLGSGEVLVFNNYMALHTRSSFKPNFSSDDRLLMRAYYMARNKNSAIPEDRIIPESQTRVV
jgi:hypothetical protein